MPSNQFSSLSQANTVIVSNKMKVAFTATPTAYGISPLQATSFGNFVTIYQDSITAFNEAEAAYRAAAQAKIAAKRNLAKQMSIYANMAYAVPGITTKALADAGLSIHSSRSTVTPVAPSELVVNAFSNRTVNLKWKRNGNPRSVSFVIEVSSNAEDWSIACVSKATKFTLNGFRPGVTKWFRVSATTRGITSPPSEEIPIYPSGDSLELKLAA